jgi:hypothetical protein
VAEASDGGRWELCSGELVARPEQQAKGGATGDPRAGRSKTRWRCKRPEGGARRAASPAGRQLCRGSAPAREGKRRVGDSLEGP